MWLRDYIDLNSNNREVILSSAVVRRSSRYLIEDDRIKQISASVSSVGKSLILEKTPRHV